MRRKSGFGLIGMFVLVAAAQSCGREPQYRGDGFGGGEERDLSFSFGQIDLAQPPPPCQGSLRCRQVDCGEGMKTSLTGKVFAPNGTLPIYNALVYVPDAEIEPFRPGVQCDVCGSPVSGKPLVFALTDHTGSFTLENVPVGMDIPLVIQTGRWRRKVTIQKEIVACSDNRLDPIKEVEWQRLPKNRREGDIPQIAIATGTYDPVECLIKKIGVDDAEFTTPNEKGRIHLYKQDGTDLPMPTQPAAMLYDDLALLRRYDLIISPCSGGRPTAMQLDNLVKYTTAGGRFFATDLMMSWVNQPAWSGPVEWVGVGVASPLPADVDTTFPKGKAFGQWLKVVSAFNMNNKVELNPAYGRVKSVKKPVQRWLYGPPSGGAEPVMHFTFNTPVNAPINDAGVPEQCGRVLFSAYHVGSSALAGGPRVFPQACKVEPLNGQEKVLAFMIFDLTACVQQDEEPPIPPIP